MKKIPTVWEPRRLQSENTCNPVLGIELEIDVPEGYKMGDGSYLKNHRDLCCILDSIHPDIFIQGDNSLSDYGIEIVSSPHTLLSHHKNIPWCEILDKTREHDYFSHDSEFACGLHIHVNRDSLGSTKEQQTETIKRILFIIHKCWIDFTTVSGRRAGLIQTWSRKYNFDLNDTFDNIYKSVIEENNSENGRRRVLNLRNKNTIEFRLFNSTQNPKLLFKRMEIINNLIKFSRNRSFLFSERKFRETFECRQIADLLFK